MTLPKIWDELAWNGIRFQKPSDWQPVLISAHRLVLETRGAVSCEIQWQPARPHTDPDSIFHQFLTRYRKKGVLFTREDFASPLPIDTRFRWIFFQWEDSGFKGSGFITVCPECGNAALIRFHDTGFPNDQARLRTYARFLNSLTDHTENQEILWAVYDIRVFLPQTYRLAGHQFLAGAFTLSFSETDQGLTLYRFSPASHLLEKQTLAEFAKKFPIPPSEKPVHIAPDVLEWAETENAHPPKTWKLSAIFRRKPIPRRLRLWHIPERNRILGVEATGAAASDIDSFDRICFRYVCIPT